jgi:hypothetical protein
VDASGFPAINDEQTLWGIRLGGELRLRLVDWFWLHGRVVTFLQPFDMASTQAEVGVLLGHPERFGLMVGYKDWRYRDESSDLNSVDAVDLKVSGLFVGMELRF